MNAGQEIDAIMDDLDAASWAWAAAGYKYDGPEWEAREAVFARLKAWNKEREQATPRSPRYSGYWNMDGKP